MEAICSYKRTFVISQDFDLAYLGISLSAKGTCFGTLSSVRIASLLAFLGIDSCPKQVSGM